MTETGPALAGRVVLVPWGCGTPEDNDRIRMRIEMLGGEISYAAHPAPGTPRMGRRPERATHEYLPKGRKASTDLPIVTAAELTSAFSVATKAFSEVMAPLVRTTHVPVVERAEPDRPGSRYFGHPWMPDAMEWPDLDGVPMAFVLQLDLASLPARPGPLEGRDGLLLFFHGEEYDEHRQSLVNVVDTTEPGGLRKPPKSVEGGGALAIVGWREVADHPDPEALGSLAGGQALLAVAAECGSDEQGQVRTDRGKLVPEAAALAKGIPPRYHCFSCDKLGGWPSWDQGDETPLDSVGSPMEMVFQVGHEGIVLGRFRTDGVVWPTWGRGHIFGSAATGEFRYVWACD